MSGQPVEAVCFIVCIVLGGGGSNQLGSSVGREVIRYISRALNPH